MVTSVSFHSLVVRVIDVEEMEWRDAFEHKLLLPGAPSDPVLCTVMDSMPACS